MTDTVKKVAEAMARKREELIARPLASIWPDLASAAISAMQGWRPIETAPNNETIFVYYDDGNTKFIEADYNQFDWVPYEEDTVGSTPKYWCYPPLPPEGE